MSRKLLPLLLACTVLVGGCAVLKTVGWHVLGHVVDKKFNSHEDQDDQETPKDDDRPADGSD